MKGQTRRHSILEVISGTIIGYLIAILSQIGIYPKLGIEVNLENNF